LPATDPITPGRANTLANPKDIDEVPVWVWSKLKGLGPSSHQSLCQERARHH
jgi:hypothetical protein